MENYKKWESIKNQFALEQTFNTETTSNNIKVFLSEALLNEVEEKERSKNLMFNLKGNGYIFTFAKNENDKYVLTSISKNTFKDFGEDSWKIGKYIERIL